MSLKMILFFLMKFINNRFLKNIKYVFSNLNANIFIIRKYFLQYTFIYYNFIY